MSKPRKIHSIWTLMDSRWSCTICERILKDSNSWQPCLSVPDCSLAEYLFSFGFDIPEEIDYCLAHSDDAELKYRVFGSKIHIYITLC